MRQPKRSLVSGPIIPALISFIIPILLSNIIQQLYTTTDRIIVGRFVSKEGLAAVGVSFPIIFLLAILLMGIFNGSTILLGHAIGAKEYNYARKIVDSTYILAGAASLVVLIVGPLIATSIIKLLGVPVEIRSQAISYLRIILLGFPGMALYYGSSSLSRAAGDSKTPLYFFTLAAVGNVILDLIFIIGFGWGVAGSAWATVIMQGSAGILQLIYFKRKRELLSFRFKLAPSKEIIARIIKLGGLTGIQQATFAINILIIQRFINTYGVGVVAGFIAGAQVDTYGRMAMLSTMIALAPFVSQNLGAGQEKRAKQGLLVALIFNILLSMIFFTLMLFFGENVVSLFNKSSEMVAIGAKFLRISSAFYWLVSLQFCVVGFLRGSGATLLPAITAVLTTAILPILALIYNNNFGYIGVFYCFPSIWLLMVTVFYIYYFSGKWRNKLRIPD